MRYLLPLLLLSTSALAQQQPVCQDAQKVRDFLTNEYGEKPVYEMTDGDNRHLIIFVNEQTGSWSVIATDDKISCVVDVGKDMRPYGKEAPKPVEPKKNPT